MKLSRQTLSIIAAGVLIIVLAFMVGVYLQQSDEQTQLNEQLTSAKEKERGLQLKQLSADQTELKKQLTQAMSQLEAAKAPFSELAGSTPTIDTLLKVAKANGLEVTEIRSPGPAEDTLGELDYWVVPLTATINGTTPDLVSFLFDLNRSLVTGVIESVTTGENTTVEIGLVVYTHRGD